MSERLTAGGMLTMAARTHLTASQMNRAGLLAWWRERKFVATIDEFAWSLRALPQAEVDRISPDMRQQMSDLVDAIVSDVESFLSRRQDHGDLRRVERNRHLVKRIYDLREVFEAIARGVAADSGMMDLRWKMKITR